MRSQSYTPCGLRQRKGFDIEQCNPAVLTVASSSCRTSQAWNVTNVTPVRNPHCAYLGDVAGLGNDDRQGVGLVAEGKGVGGAEVVAVDLIRQRRVADHRGLGKVGAVVDSPVAPDPAAATQDGADQGEQGGEV